jgi:hypothetical protein
METKTKDEKKPQDYNFEPSDELVRFKLPFLKDGTLKVSLWEALKNCIGKDIWRISVPVYFNQPLSVLQNCAGVTEYLDLLD